MPRIFRNYKVVNTINTHAVVNTFLCSDIFAKMAFVLYSAIIRFSVFGYDTKNCCDLRSGQTGYVKHFLLFNAE